VDRSFLQRPSVFLLPMVLLERLCRLKEQVASGDRPPYSAVFEIPGVFS